jgi:hypothetical protein
MLGWPKICGLAHAALWECSYKKGCSRPSFRADTAPLSLDRSSLPRAAGLMDTAKSMYKPGVITPGQPGRAVVGNFHQIPCKFNGKWVGMPWNREAKAAGRVPWPPLS